ncbi:MAG TPA: ABC transporter ATP-binding protein [Candidatus Dormibacteraeota bacterium]|nr:ABC transporter ATP-binding protein [Candidatus Dormibacteraeota bacterium]
MISAERLTKRFGAFTAIEDVSFEVARGEIVGFLGPNGAGKSTTMRILAGVFPPSHGQVRIDGHDMVRDALRARALVGYFPERVSVYVDMTVQHYLRYVGEMKGLRRRDARRAAGIALASCSLEPVADRLIGTLSKGFRQRVGIAQALVGAPRVLILDEPTAGLDPEQVADMRALIRDLRAERTVILSTHILPEVEAICDRVIIIHRGRVLALDTPANLNRRVRRSTQVVVEANGPPAEVLAALRAVPGVRAVEPQPGDAAHLVVSADRDRDLREDLAAAIVARGWGLRELRPKTLTLEEIFLALVATPSESEWTEGPSRAM